MEISTVMNKKPVDIAVVGAGAAGLMSAIWAGRSAAGPDRAKDASVLKSIGFEGRSTQAKQAPLDILLFDTRQKIGAKILMSGGTRCNVTNKEVKTSDFKGGASHFVKHVLEAFTPQETIRFFKDIGVELVLEPSGKYFPATHSAQTVLTALMIETGRAGVTLKTGIRITDITKIGNLFHLKNTEGTYQISAKKVILTTGGLSHPTTGSDGTGYKIAKSFGHTIVETFPALTPLLTEDPDWKKLSGIALEMKLSFFSASRRRRASPRFLAGGGSVLGGKNGKKECDYQDSFLFTHFGFSGPAALDISRYFASAKQEEHPQIIASFLPQHHDESLKAAFQSAQKRSVAKTIKNILAEEFQLPERFAETFLQKIGISKNESIGKCSSENRKRLIRLLLHYPLEVTGVFGYQKAEVTAGGVDLKEVNVSTMESKLADGLYFAGEILDVDGRIGGFNFQWAWSTGAIAGRSAAHDLH